MTDAEDWDWDWDWEWGFDVVLVIVEVILCFYCVVLCVSSRLAG